jgi:drug/metabolite transporter (DMT)-like permease
VNIPQSLSSRINALTGNPFVLLVFTTFFWAGNIPAGRLAVGEISPMLVVFLRWSISFILLGLFARKQITAEYKLVLPAWRLVLVLSTLGYTGFNALYYSAAHYTTGINIAIIQGASPIAILLLGLIVYRYKLTVIQFGGALLTILGVLVSASHGDWRVIAHLELNKGDLWLLIASIAYAFYTLMLKKRPACSALVFFTALAAASCLTAFPLVVWEAMRGALIWPGLKGWLIIAYISVLPSLLCQIAYIRAVEIVGPGRASIFYNLVPVFGALLSTLMLPETMSIFDLIALALVIGGILVAEFGKPA